MMKSLSLLTTVAMLALAAPAFAADTPSAKTETKVESDANGNYEKKTTSEQTDDAGTATDSKTVVKVKHDRNGNVKKSVETKSSTDPKGLMNKTTEKSKTTVKENADGTTSYKHKKKVDGKTVEEEETESK